MALPHIGFASLADTSIATTWGYDLLVKDQIHCVNEKRLYPIFDQSGFVTQDPANQIVEAPKQEESGKTSFEHQFVLDHALARKVAVAGEFNDWKPTIFLEKAGSTWKTTVTLPIDSRAQYQYKFVVNDTEWIVSPNAPKAYDSRGKENNAVAVPGKGGFSMASSVSTSSAAPSERVYEDIRHARMMLNRVHTECTRLNAEIFMH